MTEIKKNNIYSLSLSEYNEIKNKIIEDDKNLLGEIAGEKIEVKNGKDNLFWEAVGNALMMPEELAKEIDNPNWFRNEITTLKWLEYGRKYDSYYLVFLQGIPNIKEVDYDYYISLLKDTISFWQEEAQLTFIGTGKKDFTVYMVRG